MTELEQKLSEEKELPWVASLNEPTKYWAVIPKKKYSLLEDMTLELIFIGNKTNELLQDIINSNKQIHDLLLARK
jgi:hypothetical protein